MKTLHVIVSNKVATYLKRDGYIVCGNSDNQIEFTFDTEWNAHTKKTARFIWGGKYKDIEFSGNICPVPVVANTEQLKVGVYVENLSTSTSAVIPCRLSVLCGSNLVPEGTVVVPEGTPTLIAKTITENGKYPASKDGADGFYEVNVAVPGEVLPKFDAVEGFDVFLDEADKGSITVGYSAPQDVKLPNGTHRLTSIDDDNFIPSNIRKGKTIFGMTGEYEGEGGEAPNLVGIDVTPTKGYQNIVPEGEVDGFDEVIVKPIPDEYIVPSGSLNITENKTVDVTKYASVTVAVEEEALPEYSEVEDFTVFVEGSEGEVSVGYSVSEKVALPAGSPARLASVSDENFIANNIRKGKSIFGLYGAYVGEEITLQEKTVIPTEAKQPITADSGYTGLAKVTVEAIQTETRTVTPSKNTQPIAPSKDGMYLTEVTVHPIPSEYIIPSGSITLTENNKTYDVTDKASVKVEVEVEEIPEISEPLTLIASTDGAEEGELVVAYNLSEKAALPTGTNRPLGFLKDENFAPSNIKNGVNIFGVTGEYEGDGDTVEVWDGTGITKVTA